MAVSTYPERVNCGVMARFVLSLAGIASLHRNSLHELFTPFSKKFSEFFSVISNAYRISEQQATPLPLPILIPFSFAKENGSKKKPGNKSIIR